MRRPLAAVSKITKAGQIAFFSEGEDWLIDKKDEVAAEILELVRKATKKTKLYEHKGTYRMRVWMLAGDKDRKQPGARGKHPFGRQGGKA